MVKVAEALSKQNVHVLEGCEGKMGDPRDGTYLNVKLGALKDAAIALVKEVNALEALEVYAPQSGVNLRHGFDLNEEVSRFETHLILLALVQTGGNQKRAAQLLGVKQTTLNSKIKRHKIAPRRAAHTLARFQR